MNSMKAAVFESPGEVRIETAPVPEPGTDEVRVRLEGCGICASNLPVWQGKPWFDYPFPAGAPGHEGWGWIDAVGPGVSGFEIGDRVTMLSGHAFAEYDVAHRGAVLPIPGALDGGPFPGEPIGCAMNIFRRSEIRAGETVGIVGIGFLGALLTRLATEAGATVIAVSRRPCALEIARRAGAAEAISSNDYWAALDRVREMTEDRGCDCVIEATGYQTPLDLAADMTRVRGRLVIAGYHQDGPRQVNMHMWNWRGFDVINAHEREDRVYARGIAEAMDAAMRGRIDPKPLFTHIFPLDRIGEAFETLAGRPDDFMKGLICF